MCVHVFVWLRMLNITYSDFDSFIYRLYSGGSTGNILFFQQQRFRPVISVFDLLPSAQ